MAHTDGPWTAQGVIVVALARDMVIGKAEYTGRYSPDFGIGKDNARMFAAAPDLLRELKKYVAEAEAAYYGRQPNMGTYAARAAIAKAEGR